MALIKCPECGKEISDTTKTCPHCGMRIKKEKNKKKIITLVVIIILILCCVGAVLGIIYSKKISVLKEQAKAVDDKIATIVNGEVTDISSIIDIKREYDGLDDFVKAYVTNQDKLKNFKIELTADNFRDFFDLNVTYSDYYTKPKVGLIMKEYDCYCKQTSIIQPKAEFKCNNVYVTIDYNYIVDVWKGGYLDNVMLQDNGYYEATTEIHADSGWITVEQPTFFQENWEVLDIKGFITLE